MFSVMHITNKNTPGKQIDFEQLSRFDEGTTIKQQVLDIFVPPNDITQTYEG